MGIIPAVAMLVYQRVTKITDMKSCEFTVGTPIDIVSVVSDGFFFGSNSLGFDDFARKDAHLQISEFIFSKFRFD